MKKIEAILCIVVTAAVIAAVMAATLMAIKMGLGQIRQIFDGLDPQTGLMVGLGTVVLMLCSLLIAAALRTSALRPIELLRQSERAGVYQAVLDSLASPPDTITEGARGTALDRALFLHGSPLVLKEHRTLVQLLAAKRGNEESLERQFNRLMLAMRRDLGGSTVGLETLDWSGWSQGRTTAPPTQEDAAWQTAPVRFTPATPAPRL